jgi:hypothetical protein
MIKRIRAATLPREQLLKHNPRNFSIRDFLLR